MCAPTVRAAASGCLPRHGRSRSPVRWPTLPSATPSTWPSTTTSSTAISTGNRRPIACAPWVTARNWSARTSRTGPSPWKRWCRAGSTVPGTARTSWIRGSPRWASRLWPAARAGMACTGCRCSPSRRRDVKPLLLLQRRDAGLARRLVLRARATGAPDSADDPAAFDERDTTAGRDHSIERHHVIESIRLNGVLPRLGLAPERDGGACLVLGDRNRGELCAVHTLEGNEVASGVHHRDVQLPLVLFRLGDGGIDSDRGALEGERCAVGHIERHLVGHHIEWVAARCARCRSLLCVTRGRSEEHRAECRDGCELGHDCFSPDIAS